MKYLRIYGTCALGYILVAYSSDWNVGLAQSPLQVIGGMLMFASGWFARSYMLLEEILSGLER